MSAYKTNMEKLTYFSTEHGRLAEASRLMQEKAEGLDKEWSEFVEGLGLKGQVHFADVAKKLLEASVETSNIIKPY